MFYYYVLICDSNLRESELEKLSIIIGFNQSDTTYGWNGKTSGFTLHYLHLGWIPGDFLDSKMIDHQLTDRFWKIDNFPRPQTTADKDIESPDSSTSSLSGLTEFFRKFRTDRHQTDNPDRIRIADRHRARFSGKSGQKRDKDRTRLRNQKGLLVPWIRLY